MSVETLVPTTLTDVPWPDGTEVEAYLRISETMTFDTPPPGQTPAESVFVAEGEATFSSLEIGDYWAVAPLDGIYRYVAFRQQPLTPGTQGPPGPTGPTGPQGAQGPSGALPLGGDSKTWLRKNTPADGDASWYASGAVTLGLGTPSNGFGLDGDVQVDTSVGRIYYKQGGVWTSLPFYTPISATLPASPYQGQEVYLRVGPFVGNPDYLLWHLRWETNYPVDRWEFLGGGPIRLVHTSGGDLTAASTNTSLIIDNIWLEVNLPYNGIYEVDYIAQSFGVTSGLSIATVEIQRMVEAGATYTAGVGLAEQNAKPEYTANAAGTYLPFALKTLFDLRDKSATFRQPPVIVPTLQRTSGGTWALRGKREIIVRPVYLIP